MADRLLNRVKMGATISKTGLTAMAGKGAFLTFVMALGLAFSPLTRAQSVTLAWNPSTTTGVAGYMIHYGTSGTNYSNAADAGNNTSYTLSNLPTGETNFF